MKLIDFDPGICVALSDRSDGNMKNPSLLNWVDDEIIENRRKFLKNSGIGRESIALIRAEYNADDFCRYKIIDKIDNYRLDLPVAEIPVSDGLMAKTPKTGIFLPVADCLGVVIYDSKQRILMVVHCGRHNLEQDGLVKVVKFLVQQGAQPQDMKVWFSPSAGAENYPVHAFGGKSLEQVAREQLAKAGVTQIVSDNTDTTINEEYYSHSQGDKDQRFAVLAYIK
jgi:copper oxidase (laccase) domain-containing protein